MVFEQCRYGDLLDFMKGHGAVKTVGSSRNQIAQIHLSAGLRGTQGLAHKGLAMPLGYQARECADQ